MFKTVNVLKFHCRNKLVLINLNEIHKIIISTSEFVSDDKIFSHINGVSIEYGEKRSFTLGLGVDNPPKFEDFGFKLIKNLDVRFDKKREWDFDPIFILGQIVNIENKVHANIDHMLDRYFVPKTSEKYYKIFNKRGNVISFYQPFNLKETGNLTQLIKLLDFLEK